MATIPPLDASSAPAPAAQAAPMRSPAEPTRAWLSVVRTYQLCSDAITHDIKPLGLKLQQFEILLGLLHGPQTQAQLVERSFVVKSHMSALLMQMQTDGLLERLASPSDKRSKLVILTAAGLDQALACQAVQRSVMAAMFAPLDEAQIMQTEQVMNAVEAALRERAAPRGTRR